MSGYLDFPELKLNIYPDFVYFCVVYEYRLTAVSNSASGTLPETDTESRLIGVLIYATKNTET